MNRRPADPPRSSTRARALAVSLAVLAAAAAAAVIVGALCAGGVRPLGPGIGALVGLVGAFAVVGALLDAGWFMAAERARAVVDRLGRGPARVLYGAIGGALLGFAFGIASGYLG